MFQVKKEEETIQISGKKKGGEDGNGLIMGSGGVGLLAWEEEEEEEDTAPTLEFLSEVHFLSVAFAAPSVWGDRGKMTGGRRTIFLPFIPLLFTNFPRHKRFFCVFGRACWYTSLPPAPPKKNTGGPNIARRKIQTVGNYVAAKVPLRNIKKTIGRKWAPKNEEASLETLTRQNFPKLGKVGL